MQFLLNLLFPKFCIGCNKLGVYVCQDCSMKFDFLKQQYCPHCFFPSEAGATHQKCKENSFLDGAYSLLAYKGVVQTLIKDIKYKRIYSVLEDFFNILPEKVEQTLIKTIHSYQIDAIQPIPLHPNRQKIRGFNQSEEIAKYLAAKTSIPIVRLLHRKHNTSPQAQISKRTDRMYNVQDAFVYSDCILNKENNNLLLVDDLFTTGSTSQEAAKVLKQHSIKRVYAFTLAHG